MLDWTEDQDPSMIDQSLKQHRQDYTVSDIIWQKPANETVPVCMAGHCYLSMW